MKGGFLLDARARALLFFGFSRACSRMCIPSSIWSRLSGLLGRWFASALVLLFLGGFAPTKDAEYAEMAEAEAAEPTRRAAICEAVGAALAAATAPPPLGPVDIKARCCCAIRTSTPRTRHRSSEASHSKYFMPSLPGELPQPLTRPVAEWRADRRSLHSGLHAPLAGCRMLA